jgi:hypothetical protein
MFPQMKIRGMKICRTKIRVFLTACGFVVGVSLWIGAPIAGASGGSDRGNTVTVVVTTRSSSLGSPGSAGSTGGGRNVYVCTYMTAPPSMTAGLMTGGPEAGQFYIVRCTGPGIGSGKGVIIVWLANQVFGSAEGVTPTTVAQRAASSIVLPSPGIRTNPAVSTFVNIPTWLWVDSSIWHPRTARASLAGISATATASPVSIDFAMGDGSHLVCDGPGTAYDTSEPSGSQSTSCSHIYTSSSAGQPSPDGKPNGAAFVIKATITWSVSWKGDGFAGGGALPSLTTSATTSLRVEQIESLQKS